MDHKLIYSTLVALVLATLHSSIPSAMAGSPQRQALKIKANWHFRGHGYRSDAEKRQLGQAALEWEAADLIHTFNSLNIGLQLELF